MSEADKLIEKYNKLIIKVNDLELASGLKISKLIDLFKQGYTIKKDFNN